MAYSDSKRLTIGLTGGVASGKTTAAHAFQAHGVTVIDADRLARRVVEPGQPALEEIRRAFGDQVLDASGRLDRSHLRRLVFGDDEARQRLEAIIHPRVREALIAERDAAGGPYVVLVVPLLVESQFHDLVDRILVVDVPEHLQLERLMRRDDVDEQLARRMMEAQLPRRRRLAHADDVVLNTGNPKQLRELVRRLHERYLELHTGTRKSLPPQHLPAPGQ